MSPSATGSVAISRLILVIRGQRAVQRPVRPGQAAAGRAARGRARVGRDAGARGRLQDRHASVATLVGASVSEAP